MTFGDTREFWTPERTDLLRQLWLDARQSARDLGAVFGVSRNAILGKVHRLGLSSRALGRKHLPRPDLSSTVRNRDASPRPPRQPRPARARPVLVGSSIEITTVGLSFELLDDNHCRWPFNEPGKAALFCGLTRLEPHPYCAGHCRMAYVPPRRISNAA